MAPLLAYGQRNGIRRKRDPNLIASIETAVHEAGGDALRTEFRRHRIVAWKHRLRWSFRLDAEKEHALAIAAGINSVIRGSSGEYGVRDAAHAGPVNERDRRPERPPRQTFMIKDPEWLRTWREELRDLVTQLITLSTGSIVVAATFSERLSGSPSAWLAALSVIGFSATIFVGLLARWRLFGFHPDMTPDQAGWQLARFTSAALLAAAAFASSLLLLTLFAVISLV